MKRNITSSEVVKAIQTGILSAQSDYKRSAEDWISNAPEYLCTVRAYNGILRKLKALDRLSGSSSGFVTLECPSTTIGKIIKRGPRTRNPLTEHSRGDVFLWGASGAPRAVIEIKRSFSNVQGIQNDVERIRHFLLWCRPRPVFGVFCTIVYRAIYRTQTIKETTDLVWEEIERLEALVMDSAAGLSCSPHYIEPKVLNVEDDDGRSYTRLWCPLCFTLRRPRTPKRR